MTLKSEVIVSCAVNLSIIIQAAMNDCKIIIAISRKSQTYCVQIHHGIKNARVLITPAHFKSAVSQPLTLNRIKPCPIMTTVLIELI